MKYPIAYILVNLILGLLWAAAVLGILWWLGYFWLTGITVIVPLVAVYVAYKSAFPVPER